MTTRTCTNEVIKNMLERIYTMHENNDFPQTRAEMATLLKAENLLSKSNVWGNHSDDDGNTNKSYGIGKKYTWSDDVTLMIAVCKYKIDNNLDEYKSEHKGYTITEIRTAAIPKMQTYYSNNKPIYNIAKTELSQHMNAYSRSVQEKDPKHLDNTFIFNPQSYQYVKRSGPIGKKLVESEQKGSVYKPTQKRIKKPLNAINDLRLLINNQSDSEMSDEDEENNDDNEDNEENDEVENSSSDKGTKQATAKSTKQAAKSTKQATAKSTTHKKPEITDLDE